MNDDSTAPASEDPAPDTQLLPFEIDDLCREVEANPQGSPCGLDRETALRILGQLKELKLERDKLLAELVEAGLG